MKAFYYRLLGEDNPLLRYPELYEAALNEFAQKDFEDASLNSILKEANMSKGSLYHNFGDKFGLYLALMDMIVRKKTDFFADALKQRPQEFDFFLTVKQLVKATIAFMHTDERLYQVLNHNLEASEEFRQQLVEIFPHSPSFGFDALVHTALEAGEIDQRYSPDFISGVFEILLEHVHRLLPPDHPGEKVESVVSQLIELTQYGIAPRKGKNHEPCLERQ
ncbi:MAG: TetR/AcrR family transcriptional regulator [Clostridiaceae bacterium]|jgi:AcrR family transcriptional regulator|nr:TetR/AcrR family transcriptional regulator [Clostridiaceae bacterium]